MSTFHDQVFSLPPSLLSRSDLFLLRRCQILLSISSLVRPVARCRQLFLTKDLTLKLLSATHWESRTEAIKPSRYELGGIYYVLFSVYNNAETDNSIRDEAFGLLNSIKQFKFLCFITIWYKILNCINPISKLLQTKDYDIPSAMELLRNCKKNFNGHRSDGAFAEMLCVAKELADEIDIAANFEVTQPRHRVRHKNVNFDYEA
ncbi:DUF4371 domain-containing protein [Trichonephila clavipes]|nr:DUF4371 domain-containing protein [Trichonephila clavipes]